MKPSEVEAMALHRKYGSSEVVVRHCKTVASVAKVLGEKLGKDGVEIDLQALIAGALLHDIGRSRTQTVRHGVEGSEILKGEGVDEVVVQIVRRHVGAGISVEEAKKLGLPDYDYIPHTKEETVVCFADKMVDADRVRPFEEEVKRFQRKGHDVGRLLALKKRLALDIGEDPETLIFEKLKGSR